MVAASTAAPLSYLQQKSVSFRDMVSQGRDSSFSLVVQKAPHLVIPVPKEDMDHEVLLTSKALLYRFNGLWPCLADLYSWILVEWNPLVEEGTIIFPPAKWFFIVVFSPPENRDFIFSSGVDQVFLCSFGPLLLIHLQLPFLRLLFG